MYNLKYNYSFVHGFTKNDIPFNVDLFSAFKHGDTCVAKKMAHELVEHFEQHFLDVIKNKKCLIYSSPYSYISTASLFLTQYFIEILSKKHSDLDITIAKIGRRQTYSEDYGLLSAEQRYNLISNDTYSFLDLPHESYFLIFIDDISITGTHQRVIEKLLKREKINNDALFLYFAKLTDNSDPSIENYLNNFKIKNTDDLLKLILSSSFQFTTRTVKRMLVLDSKDFMMAIDILREGRPGLISELCSLSISNRYDHIKEYEENVKKLLQEIN